MKRIRRIHLLVFFLGVSVVFYLFKFLYYEKRMFQRNRGIVDKNSQAVLWEDSCGGSGSKIHDFVQTKDGKFLLVGETIDRGSNMKILKLFKYNPSSNYCDYLREYGICLADMKIFASPIENEYIISGNLKGESIWLFKLSENYYLYSGNSIIGGNFTGYISNERGGGLRYYRFPYDAKLRFISNGRHLITWRMTLGKCEYHAMITCIDSSGNVVWEYLLPEDMTGITSVIEDPDGSVIVCVEGWGRPDLVLKLDYQGNVVWEENIDAWAVCPASDNGYIFLSIKEEKPYLIKLDSSGNVVWKRDYDSKPVYYGLFLQQVRDGGYIFLAVERGKDDYKNYERYWFEVYPEFYREDKVWIFRTDAAGNLQWRKTLFNVYPNAIKQIENGNFVLVGKKWPKKNTDEFERWIAEIADK